MVSMQMTSFSSLRLVPGPASRCPPTSLVALTRAYFAVTESGIGIGVTPERGGLMETGCLIGVRDGHESSNMRSVTVLIRIFHRGCPFREGCHFLHFVPGGYNAVAQVMNLTTIVPQPSRNMGMPPTLAQTNGSSQSSVKTRMCNKYNTAECCKYGDKCHFAHCEWELGKPIALFADDPPGIGMPPRPGVSTFGGDYGNPAASFGAVATAKISVDASLAGAIIGKGE
ncbi:hypothetical protein SAY87_008081 [Trapa incisa]|uniref:C3H1-type domain-containing protein n=1 Tax=Trapa incisa TaxID=236973 RepID=A0AAN7KJN4_9MYRT|nr:hypothetical protein SAY87_008081 [Trapa incisa]